MRKAAHPTHKVKPGLVSWDPRQRKETGAIKAPEGDQYHLWRGLVLAGRGGSGG